MSPNLTSRSTMRRGPTVRGRRPTIGRVGIRRRSSASDQEILTKSDSDTATEEVELHEVEEPPFYKHGEETFGDIITHPRQEYQAHQERKTEYNEHRASWALEHGLDKDDAKYLSKISVSDSRYTAKTLTLKTIRPSVIHFRNLRAEQNFAIDYETAKEFERKLKLTQKEKIMFNGVHDTESLTSFLHNAHRDYAIKVHHGHSGGMQTLTPNLFFSFYTAPVFPVRYSLEIVSRTTSIVTDIIFPRSFPEPDLSADIGEEKAASWLELFYDLFYIASLSEFTHTHVIKDWASLGVYASWFVIMWWAWTASSLYTTRFDTDDVLHHIWKLIEMCAVIGMAGTSDHFLNSSGFVYGYMALKGVLVIEYGIVFSVALIAKSKSRVPLLCYVVANVISIILWGVSLLFINNNSHFALWYVGLFVELMVNLIVRDNKRLSWAASHLAERFGLLTLIVLGENLMGFVKLVAEAGTTIHVVIPNFMAVVIIFGFFFNYFEDFSKEVLLHNRNNQLWVYLHFPLHLCQVAFGIALINMLRIYRIQYEKAHSEISGEEGTTASEPAASEPTATSNAETPGSSIIAPAEKPAKRDTFKMKYENDGHELAARAVEAVGGAPNPYSPVAVPPLPLPSSSQPTMLPSLSSSFISTAATLTASVAMSTLSAIHQNAAEAVASNSTSPSESEEADLTPQEQTFIYKTFLITGGLIMTINSLIKLLNTKVHDIYGKIIILCRILNAIVLWSICALPFTQLSAILLISVMTGSLIIQALIDLLD
ncbi:hypothetical protein INT44_005012 [Umbelopsis vinacea]|uniref:Bacterial low temperature requirement A protein-domain-containing protein n=1 Tax=Umbelopsis vinacea TaxID=44442 RepID=A0A8H7UIN8_9FUNG|nr:hypothetical protein INT44_005012 [Umbelopsis vinacea]